MPMRARLRVQNLQCLVYAVVQPCDERTCPAPCDMSYCCVQKRDGLQSPGLLDISVTALCSCSSSDTGLWTRHEVFQVRCASAQHNTAGEAHERCPNSSWTMYIRIHHWPLGWDELIRPAWLTINLAAAQSTDTKIKCSCTNVLDIF